MNIKSFFLGIFFVLLWSSAFTSAKILVNNAPPLLVLSLRFLLTGTLGFLINNLLFPKVKLSKIEWFLIIVFGICQNSFYLGLNFIAMDNIDAYLAVVIASLLPIFVAIFSFLIKLEKINFFSIIGMLLGFYGCWIIVAEKINDNINLYGLLLCLIAVIALAVATLIIKSGFSNTDQVLKIVSIQMIVGGIPLFLLSSFYEIWEINFTTSFIIAFIYTCVFPGLIATIIWFKLVKSEGVIKASSFHFLNPPMGVIIALIILGERINKNDVLGVIIIMVALIFVQNSNKKRLG